MTAIPLSKAAELAGKDKTTLWRHAKIGKLSTIKRDGVFLVDVSELERVYGKLHGRNNCNGVAQHGKQRPATVGTATDVSAVENEHLHVEVEVLQRLVATLESDKADLKRRLDVADDRHAELIAMLPASTQSRQRLGRWAALRAVVTGRV